MPSKTELLLPDVMKGIDAPLDSYLKTLESPLNDALKTLEGFIDDLMPDKTRWLDWVFYALGGEDYLRDDFDDTKKRAVLKRLFEIYRHKGTVKGLGVNWGLLSETPLIKANTPPHKGFCGVSIDDNTRRQYEAMHPEIRIYPFRHQGKVYGSKRNIFAGLYVPAYTAMTDAILRIGDYVELYDPITDSRSMVNTFLVTQETVKRQALRVAEVRLKGIRKGIFLSDKGRQIYTVRHGADSRLYVLHLHESYSDEVSKRVPLSVRPSIRPFRTSYDTEAIRGKAVGLYLSNRYKDVYSDKGGSYVMGRAVKSDAAMRLCKKTRLFDPKRAMLNQRQALNFIGPMRVGGLRSNYAEAMVDMAYRDRVYNRKWLLSKGVQGKVDRMLWAGRLSRQAGCKVSVSINNRQVIKASSGIVCGKYAVGQYMLAG